MEHNWSEHNAESNQYSPLFGNFYNDFASSGNRISIDRINELFQSGHISPDEHSLLLQRFYPREKRISRFALACLFCSVFTWILMLKFTTYTNTYELLSGEGRLIAGTILPPVSLIFYYLAVREMREVKDVGGSRIAVAGLALALALLTLAIPVLLMKLFL